MVIEWNNNPNDKDGEGRPKIRAAQYVRMSTEHQQYSTGNQEEAIQKYADARGYEIVRTYADEGKSGLNIGGRAALQNLIADIESGETDFKAILVYDVSRWGRFQDPDEAASYELRCRTAGVDVQYCAEQFENDGSLGSSMIKTMKRAMAGEYSRELSVKVFAGQANLIKRGFRQGGAAGYGLRRMLVDQDGQQKGELKQGEQKSLQTDRVILVPGPKEEQSVVQEIFERFSSGASEQEVASDLNKRGITTDLDRSWTRGVVHQLLLNEKYIGNNVWGRTSFKLKQAHEQNDPEQWVRCDGAFEGIVDPAIFRKAGAIIEARSFLLTDDEMIEKLGEIFKDRGMLSGLIIDELEDIPSSSCYRSRFGSLLRAYALVGYEPDHDYSYIETNKRLKKMHPKLIDDLIARMKSQGVDAVSSDELNTLLLNKELKVSVAITRCFQTSAGSLRWKLRLDNRPESDLTLAVRMNPDNEDPLDYYLLPKIDMHQAMLRLCEYNGFTLDAYRFDKLDEICRLFRRAPLRLAA